MDSTGSLSTGYSPMGELVMGVSLIALVPGALAIIVAILRRCLSALEDKEVVLRPPEPSTRGADRSEGWFATHEDRDEWDRTWYAGGRPWEG